MAHIIAIFTRVLFLEMQEYLEKLSSFIEQDFYRFQEESNEIKEGLSKEEIEEFHKITAYDYELYKKIFPRILFNSSIVSIYSILESEINSIADRIQKNKNEKFSLADIRGSDSLTCAKNYILRLTGVDICKHQDWQCLKDLQRVRNIIVHTNGRLLSKNDIELAKKHKIIYKTQGNNNEIAVTYSYAIQSIGTLINFFNITIDNLSNSGHLTLRSRLAKD